MAELPIAFPPVLFADPDTITDRHISHYDFLFGQHRARTRNLIQDPEDQPVRQSDVRLPCAPKKGREQGLNTTMPGSEDNTCYYHYLPAIPFDDGYNFERARLDDQQLAKKLRKKNKFKRLHPGSRKSLCFESGDGAEAGQAKHNSDDIGVEGFDAADYERNDIGWEANLRRSRRGNRRL